MEYSEKCELGFILVVAMGCWIVAPALPGQVGIGTLLLMLSALLLLQSLVRDLGLLARSARGSAASPRRVARGMCVESTVGATGIVIGAILLGSGMSQPVMMERWSWTLSVVVVTGIGLLIKDYVVEWGPWRIRRDKDHMNIVFRWKR